MWKEYYYLETEQQIRIEKIADILKDLDNQTPKELQKIYHAADQQISHNYQHFYGGQFEKILWQELSQMLAQISKDWAGAAW